MIHLKSIHLLNFGNVEELFLDFTVHDLLILKGANGSGKTTIVEGLWQILRQKFPQRPIKEGKQSGGALMVLEDGTKIEYLAKRDGDDITETLTVTNESGRQLGKSEQTAYLRQLIGGVGSGFDLHEFLRVLGTKPAREMLGKLSLQCGADMQVIEKAKLKYDGVFKDRTDAKNKIEAQKARALPYNEELAEKSPVDAAELSRQKSEIEAHNVKYTNSETIKAGIENQLAELPKNKASIEADILTTKNAYDAELARLNAKFEDDNKRLNERLEGVSTAEKDATERLSNAQKWLADPANAPKSTEAIDKQLADLTVDNEAISEAKRKKAEHEELRRLQLAWEVCDKAVKDAEKAKTEAVAACKLPAGLSFTDDGEGLNYLNPDNLVMPLEKASEAQKIMIAVQLQLSQLGELALFTANCSALDPLALKELGEMLRAKGIDAALEVRANTLAEMGLHVQLIEEHLGLPLPTTEKPETNGGGTIFDPQS